MSIKPQLTPYLATKDARTTLNFYQSVFGGEVVIKTFGDSKVPNAPENGVMHGELNINGEFFIMASEAMENFGEYKGITLTLSGKNVEELKNYFEKLSVNGVIAQQLIPSGWGTEFGMIIDQFGVSWMFDIG